MPQLLLQPPIVRGGLLDTVLAHPRGAPGGIQFVAGGVAGGNFATESVLWPVVPAVGDVAFLFYATGAASITTQPAGFTQVATQSDGALTFSTVYQRVCDGTESGNISITTPTANRSSLALVIYRGLDPTAPVDAIQSFVESVSGTTHAAPAITTATPGDLVITSIAERIVSGTTNWIPPTGYTVREDTLALSNGTGGSSIGVAEELQATTHVSGASLTPGVWTSGNGAAASNVVVWTLALSPVPAPGSGVRIQLPDDPGSVTDSLTVSATVPLAEVATGADALGVAASVPLADAGATADAIAVAASVPLVDAGTITDALGVTTVVPLADAGSAADTLSAAASVPLADTGTVTDALSVAVLVPLTDSGSVADALAVGVSVALADAGTATDALAVGALVALTDAGVVADALTATTAGPPPHLAGTAVPASDGTSTAALASDGTSTAVLAAETLATAVLVGDGTSTAVLASDGTSTAALIGDGTSTAAPSAEPLATAVIATT